jgi:leucyl aminopeptidase (aminopeptidase T)
MSLLGLYPYKKTLKESIGQPLRYEETSIAGLEYKANGTVYVQGPHPDSLRWAAEVTLKDGKIVKVR